LAKADTMPRTSAAESEAIPSAIDLEPGALDDVPAEHRAGAPVEFDAAQTASTRGDESNPPGRIRRLHFEIVSPSAETENRTELLLVE
jgi:hypothetical protein